MQISLHSNLLVKNQEYALNKSILKDHWFLILAGLTLTVRLVYLFELASLEDFSILLVDEKWHWLWAQEIINDSFWGTTAYFRAPLYPYFLAFCYFISNGSILIAKIIQILLSVGTLFFIFKLTQYLFNRLTAIVAGFLYAFYGLFVFYEAMFLIPVLFLLFTMWGLSRLIVLQEKSALKVWLTTGIIFGLATISRPNILLVVPFLMLWLYYRDINIKGFINRSRKGLLLLVGLIIVITPVTIRNYVVTGEFILISSQGGINLYLGNNEKADGLTMLMPEVELDESVSWSQFGVVTKRAAEIEKGKTLSSTEESSFWSGKAKDFILKNPGKFINLLWRKTVYLMAGFENSDNTDIYYQRNKSILYSALVWHKGIYFPYGLLLPLGLVGSFLLRKQFKKLLPLYIFFIAYIPTIILFLVTARHRLVLIPILMILTAGGIVYLKQNFKKLKQSEIVISALILLAALVVFNQTYYDETNQGGTFQIHFNNALQYERMNDYQKAEAEYLLAYQEFPNSPTLLNNLGFVQYKLGRTNPAEQNFRQAIQLKPDYSAAYNNLGLLMNSYNQPDSAITLYKTAISVTDKATAPVGWLSRIYMNIGEAFETKQQLDSAEYYFLISNKVEEARYPKAITFTANFYARNGRFGSSDSLYNLAAKFELLDADDYFNWGYSFFQRQLFGSGIDMLYKAVALDKSLYQAYFLIGAGYYETSYPRDSIEKYINLSLKYNPQYQPALRFKREQLK